jgi:UDP-glucuronate 4-epimerase
MAPFRFAEAIERGGCIDIYNYGRMQRDFTYVDDAVAGILQAARRPAPTPSEATPQFRSQLYNIGSNRPVELYELVSTLETCLGIEAKLRFLPMQPGDVLDTYADIESSQRDFNYRPRVNLRQGLEHFVKWYRDYYREAGNISRASATVL